MKTLTVTELTFAIKSLLEPQFRGVSVQGEISNFKVQASGHLYFSLKDAGAQISAVLFKGNAAQLARMPKEGDQVVASGELSIYAPRGGYQIVVRELQFLGLGELLLKLHKLKETLQARGWFDKEKKQLLPKLPKQIGVVTSPTGAVIQDILNVLTRRFKGFHVVLNPVKVQGEGAAAEIAQAIDDFNRYGLADVLIVGRGGGSIEDLWAFNEEIVARAIFESKIPIISAVGHETDFTIADWVADVRAPTPSAAAEIAIAEKTNLLRFLAQARAAIEQQARRQAEEIRQKLLMLQKHPFFASPHTIVESKAQALDAMQEDILNATRLKMEKEKLAVQAFERQLALLEPTKKIAEWKNRLKGYSDRLAAAIGQIVVSKRDRLKRMADHLQSINPHQLLKKGYSILFAENGNSIILSTKDVSLGLSVRALLHDGELIATVDQIK
jgi:exodeoxyribonuclease VII large subunit